MLSMAVMMMSAVLPFDLRAYASMVSCKSRRDRKGDLETSTTMQEGPQNVLAWAAK
jgi:hypothetical protein